MRIVDTDLNFEREPLSSPFGFKGGYLSELWQTVIRVKTAGGSTGVGLGVQSVLWSDPRVFTSCSEAAGNSMMLAVTAFAATKMKHMDWSTPIDLLDQLLPATYDYARLITDQPDLKQTFALNALVAVDNAVWLAYADAGTITCFDNLVPADCKPGLSYKNRRVVSVPAVGYGMPILDIVKLVDSGAYVLKIKIGSDPSKDGDQEKMLAWDMYRIGEIHRAVGHRHGGPGESKPILYYLDANQRYDSRERVMRLMDHLEKLKVMDRVLLFEEPYPEDLKIPVDDIPLTVVADESAHTCSDVIERIELGYKAIALKPVAKTLSMTLQMARAAFERNTSCFCADLTVNPVLVDWNKSIAARLKPLPGLPGGALENNGVQNYRDWARMLSYHPRSSASWIKQFNGEFIADDEFFSSGGGMFEPSAHYNSLVSRG